LKKRLAIITTHPIQYHAPLFELLAKRGVVDICVFYTWGATVMDNKYDPGFNKDISWDIDLLNGYNFIFLENSAHDKGSHHFNGIINKDIISELKVFKPDALLVFGWSFNSHLKAIRYFSRKLPIYFRGDSTLLDHPGYFRKYFRMVFLKWVYRHIDKAFYVGKRNYDYYKYAGLKDEQLVFSPHAIDNARFSCSRNDCISKAAELKKSLRIELDDFVFLFAGKFETKKNPYLLLDAFLLSDMGPHVKLIMAGNGPLEIELKRKYSNCSSIIFIDFQNQSMMPSLYNIADVFVLPSYGPGETWGLAVNEAMAGSKCVVVSDQCGCAVDLVYDNENGYIFKSGDKAELSNILKKISSNKQLAKSFGKKSLEIITNFSFLKIAESIESVL